MVAVVGVVLTRRGVASRIGRHVMPSGTRPLIMQARRSAAAAERAAAIRDPPATVLRGHPCHACAERARKIAHEPVAADKGGHQICGLTSTVASGNQVAEVTQSV